MINATLQKKGGEMSSLENNFEAWLAECLGADQLLLDGWTAPKDTGYSNETNIFDAHVTIDGASSVRRLVQRLGPSGGATMFREYDLERQCRIMLYLKENSSLPVPNVVGMAMNTDRPYYVMDFIGGDIPKDGHTAADAYTTSGFLFDGTPEERRRYFDSLITCMAQLHQVPVTNDFAEFFKRDSGPRTPMQKEADWWIDLYEWGKGGKDQNYPQLDDYVDWIGKNIPDMDDCQLVWQDGRPANTIAANYEVVAMLDWELATLGPGEQDLFFHLAMHNLRQKQPGANVLEGVPTEQEQIALYEKITGRTVRHEAFFRKWAKFRMAVIQLVFCKAHGIPIDEISYDGVIDDASFINSNYS